MAQSREFFVKLLKSRGLFRSNRASTPAPSLTEDQLELCAKYFDLDHYRKVSGIFSFTRRSGLDHYLRSGWRDNLDPSMNFSTRGYLDLYPDVAEGGINPLVHYVLHGQFENRHIQRVDGGFGGKIESLSRIGVRGWAVNERNREMVFPLKIMINGQYYGTIENGHSRPDLVQHGISGGAGGFELAIPFDYLEHDTYQLSVEFPDGSGLTETITVDAPARIRRKGIPARLPGERRPDLKVVVPIYNALEDVRACIARLRKYTSQGVEVILIDDGSSDPAIADELGKVEDDDMFRVLHNQGNMGFTKTVNRGLDEAGDADVIILNSDARVTPRWVEGMDAAAQSRPKVATVTAMSDRAGAFSAPSIGNDNSLPPGVSEEDFAKAFRRRSLRLYPEVPTGNGFCMLIRRAALNELGGFDADAFPRGYGEENDFCMRALRAGWANLIDDATYVFHDRSKSFGEEKDKNIAKGRAVVDERYPEYKLLTRIFQTGSSIGMARFRARMALSDCTNGHGILPRALFVLATRTGGTPQTNLDLMGALTDVFECFVLACDSSKLELSIFEGGENRVLKTHQLQEPIEPLTHTSSEYDTIVASWLGELDLYVVHIRHLGWHSLNLPALARETGARVVMSFHDYYSLSPSLKLLDENNDFCGSAFTELGAQRAIEIWPAGSLPILTRDWIDYWQKRMGEVLSYCDSFVTTSQSARDRIARAFPKIPTNQFHVIPHGRDFARFRNLRQPLQEGSPIRILVPGNINEAKGLNLIASLTDLDQSNLFEFHILGGVRMDGLTDHQRSHFHFHGRYNREDFGEKVAAIAPHFGVIFSVWDETYCHTLTEMWSVGLPVAVLDFPNVRNRVEKSGAGWILEDQKPEAVFASLVSISSDQDALAEKGLAAQRWQDERGRAQSCSQMASRYLDVYRGRNVGEPDPKIAVLKQFRSDDMHDNRIKPDRVLERFRNRLERSNSYVRGDAAAAVAQMRLGMIDGVITQPESIPTELLEPFLEIAEETKTPIILELGENLVDRPTDENVGRSFDDYEMHLEKLVSQCALITAPTQSQIASSLDRKIRAIQLASRIEARLWAGGGKAERRLTPHFVFIATRSNQAECELALDIFERGKAQSADLHATVVGAPPMIAWPEWVDAVQVPHNCQTYTTFVPWLRSVTREVTVGILPCLCTPLEELRLEQTLLEYGALGLPVLGTETQFLRDAAELVTGGLSLVKGNSLDTWSAALAEAMSRQDHFAIDGQSLQSWIFANRVIEAHMNELDEVVREAL